MEPEEKVELERQARGLVCSWQTGPYFKTCFGYGRFCQ